MGTPLSTTTWTSLGPAPVTGFRGAGNLLASGRIEGVAPHPTIAGRFFVAGQNGGIWQTNDGGNTWKPLTDTQPSLSLTARIICCSVRKPRHYHRRCRIAARRNAHLPRRRYDLAARADYGRGR